MTAEQMSTILRAKEEETKAMVAECDARNAVRPDSTDDERRCKRPAGDFEFHGSHGVWPLCEAHEKSYKECVLVLSRRSTEQKPSA